MFSSLPKEAAFLQKIPAPERVFKSFPKHMVLPGTGKDTHVTQPMSCVVVLERNGV